MIDDFVVIAKDLLISGTEYLRRWVFWQCPLRHKLQKECGEQKTKESAKEWRCKGSNGSLYRNK